MDTYIVITLNGEQFVYEALGPTDALDAFNATDGRDNGDGTAPMALGVFLANNEYVGQLARRDDGLDLL